MKSALQVELMYDKEKTLAILRWIFQTLMIAFCALYHHCSCYPCFYVCWAQPKQVHDQTRDMHNDLGKNTTLKPFGYNQKFIGILDQYLIEHDNDFHNCPNFHWYDFHHFQLQWSTKIYHDSHVYIPNVRYISMPKF